MRKIMVIVEGNMKQVHPDKFTVVFDRCCGGATHYVRVFPTYSDKNAMGYGKKLWGLSTMGVVDALDLW